MNKARIAKDICHMSMYAHWCDKANDNVGVLKWLFMIEFYKDLYERAK